MGRRKLDVLNIIDIEATCWRNNSDRPPGAQREIIEIGLTELHLRDLVIGKTESILVKPKTSEVTAFCTELTGITPEMADNGLPIRNAMEWLNQFNPFWRTWASFGDYDRTMFMEAAARTGRPYPFGPRHINIKSHIAIVEGWSREKGMAKALEHFALELQGDHHRAGPDTRNIARLYAHCMRKWRS